MAESADDPHLYWIDPERAASCRSTIFTCPRSSRRTVRKGPFEVTLDRAFEDVVAGCAARAPGAADLDQRHDLRPVPQAARHGLRHSVETWLDGELVGGLYGVALGGAFFGESMFCRETDASKVALVHLVARLKRGGFALLDTQFVTEHLEHFGAVEIDRAEFHKLLEKALARQADFHALPTDVSPQWVLDIVQAQQPATV